MNRHLCGGTLTIIMLLGSFLLTPEAHATTRYGWGTIVSIQFEEVPKAQGQARWPHFKVLLECGNQISAKEWTEQLVPIHAVGRHGPRLYLLDGKLSTPKEALKVGRLVNLMADQYIAVSSTVLGPEARAGKREPANAIYMFDVGGISTPAEVYNPRAKKWETRDKATLRVKLFLDVEAGKVRDAFVAPSWRGGAQRPYQAVDASGVSVVDGTITGTFTLSLNPNIAGWRLPDGLKELKKTFTINATVDANGTITSAGDRPRRIGLLLNRPDAMPVAGTFWVRFADIPHSRDVGFAVAPLVDGKLGKCSVMYNKGKPLSVFEDVTITDDENGIAAKLVGDLKVWGTVKPCTIELKARRFGNRMLLGDYTLTWGDMVITDHLRGGIEPAGAPPLVNLDPSILAAAKPAIDEWKAKKRAAKKK